MAKVVTSVIGFFIFIFGLTFVYLNYSGYQNQKELTKDDFIKSGYVIKPFSNKYPNVLEPLELWENRDKYVDKEVLLLGKIIAGIPACTQAYCPKTNECCNSCMGSMEIFVKNKLTIQLTGNEYDERTNSWLYLDREIRCDGTECSLSCYPFEKDKYYFIKGVLRLSKYGKYSFELLEIED